MVAGGGSILMEITVDPSSKVVFLIRMHLVAWLIPNSRVLILIEINRTRPKLWSVLA